MARISQVIDDLTGETLTEDVEPTTITVDGRDYTLDLGSSSKERLVRWLNGEDSLTRVAPQTAAKKGTGKRSSTETYGYDYADVKAWAIANGMKAANGNPVTEDTPRIGQHIYDDYHKAQQGE